MPGVPFYGNGALPVIALSHYWRTKEHPDPDGETAGLVIDALNQRWDDFEKKGVTDLGILIDWCGLYQAPRTEEQTPIFAEALKAINQARRASANTHEPPPSVCPAQSPAPVGLCAVVCAPRHHRVVRHGRRRRRWPRLP